MKKLILPLIVCMLVLFAGTVYAADEYSFNLEYTGKIEVGVEKDAVVTLTGVNGPLFTNVRIKVDITGPSIPKLLAYDTNGVQHDIAQIGYWGPDAGFPVQGDFTNTTPIKATFSKSGEYAITLSLIDVANQNTVITSRTINLQVSDVEDTDQDTGINNTVGNTTTNTTENNAITEIPKAGWSFGEMIAVLTVIMIITICGVTVYQKKIKV